ncbi:MAG TPA: hypothetical protein VHE30_09165 [Polyangiaceae bacterium]|nr:hypothetical protein [Polyangiaceae bacterium]
MSIRSTLFRAAVAASLLSACAPPVRETTSLQMVRHEKTPRDASVIIDEEYVGPLGWVGAKGVRLLRGPHRITIERDGYFPYDVAVVAGKEPIRLDVNLVPIPD